MPSSILNSDDGVISGTSGIKTTGGDDGSLKIQTNGTDAASVTSGQVFSFVNNFGTVANLPAYQCRAWVNFNGTNTVAIRASGNVSSVTDNDTGDYTVNFTTAMPDANYSAPMVCNGFDSGSIDNPTLQLHNSVAPTTSALRIQCKRNGSTSFFDRVHNHVSVFR
jgi:hypothetical protein